MSLYPAFHSLESFLELKLWFDELMQTYMYLYSEAPHSQCRASSEVDGRPKEKGVVASHHYTAIAHIAV